MSIVHKEFYQSVVSLQKIVEETNLTLADEEKRTKNYLNWISTKSELIRTEDTIQIPLSALPKIVNNYKRSVLKPDDLLIFDQHYQSIGDNKYQLNTQNLNDVTISELANMLLLVRGNVFWIEFGFNIGNEFGGKHPGIILRKLPNAVVVVPLSSQTPENVEGYHVKVPRVYNYRNQVRWTNVLRVREVALKRLDFNSPVGDVKGDVLTNISNAISTHGIR